MFSRESSKLAVLESKINIYEELSREMLSKLESAVDKISEGNSRIATILAKHDERIEQSIKTDELIIKIIDEVKEENREDHKKVMDRIEKIEDELKALTKFRWQIGGVVAITLVILGVFNTILPKLLDSFYLTNPKTQVMMLKIK